MASRTFVSAGLVAQLDITPSRQEMISLQTIDAAIEREVDIYNISIHSLANRSQLEVEAACFNSERYITNIANPRIGQLKNIHPEFKELYFSEEQSKGSQLQVSMLFGANDFKRIKTTTAPIFSSSPDGPVAELTILGWVIMGGGVNSQGKCNLTLTGQQQFDKLTSWDSLGLEDEEDAAFDHEGFKEQIIQEQDGKYCTGLPWKPNIAPLPDNKSLAQARLVSMVKRLERTGKLVDYDAAINEQIELGYLTPVSNEPVKNIHYLAHHGVENEASSTTPLRIVFDCSARANASSPSLNDCLETGPKLLPHIFSLLLRARFKKYLITGDITKAFYQIKLKPEDQHFQRVIWFKDLKSRELTEYIFGRVIMGNTSSPYILAATLQKHLGKYAKSEYSGTAEALLKTTYVDDLQGGGNSIDEVIKFKREASHILSEGGFTLAPTKWHSNVRDAEGVDCPPTSTILGITWNKVNDTWSIAASIPTENIITKRKVLATINGIFDPLNWSAPFKISALLIFSDICLAGLKWDEPLTEELVKRWNDWVQATQEMPQLEIPRAICTKPQSTFAAHGFADASSKGLCACIYIVEYWNGEVQGQNLLAAKIKVAPKNQTIPRLELAAAHVLAKVMSKVIEALSDINIVEVHYWGDSMTALHWVHHAGTYSIYVRNRVQKIRELTKDAVWRHIRTEGNPADLATRGMDVKKLGSLWFKGPSFLSDKANWPTQPEFIETEAAAQEKIIPKVKVLLNLPHATDFIDDMCQKYPYKRLIRITVWLKRWKSGLRGPFHTTEWGAAENIWFRLVQQHLNEEDYEQCSDSDGILKFNSRIPNHTPTFLPKDGEFTRRLIEYLHEVTLHGGVEITMAKVRKRFWIPRLRSLVKTLIHKCNVCKQYRIKRLKPPATSKLPNFRASYATPFNSTGVDFAGPIYYKRVDYNGKKEDKSAPEKAYVLIFTCAVTRAVHLSLCKDQTAITFQAALKRFIVRRGKPSLLISDNAKTFQATSEWLKYLKQDHDLFSFLNQQHIDWKFNLSRAPWWGGFYERLIGIIKKALSKQLGHAILTFSELSETLLDIEAFMNERPLTYQEELDTQKPLTPNLLMGMSSAPMLEEDLERMNFRTEQAIITKRWKYLQRTQCHLRKRWQEQYLHALQERHQLNPDPQQQIPQIGAIVLVTDTLAGRMPVWNLGKIEGFIEGRDGIIRGLKVKLGNGFVIERPLQLVRNLEIVSTKQGPNGEPELPEETPLKEFTTTIETNRPSRKAKQIANEQVKTINLLERNC